MKTRKYRLKNKIVQLEVNQNVFAPTIWAEKLSEHIEILPKDKVIDIGTGSGILAILASKYGAITYATDISQSAIDSARWNAIANKVEIILQRGSFFCNFNFCFDKIIANLPQEIVPPNHTFLRTAIDGGSKGNNVLLQFLDVAVEHMHDTSVLYTIVSTMSDYKTTFSKMSQLFNVTILHTYRIPCKPFVVENLDYYLKLKENKIIDIVIEEGKYYLFLFILSLTKR